MKVVITLQEPTSIIDFFGYNTPFFSGASGARQPENLGAPLPFLGPRARGPVVIRTPGHLQVILREFVYAPKVRRGTKMATCLKTKKDTGCSPSTLQLSLGHFLNVFCSHIQCYNLKALSITSILHFKFSSYSISSKVMA